MPRLIDLDQTVIFTITDETQGGIQYEMQMTVAEVFDKFFNGFQPEVVDAIPVEWLKACGKRGSLMWIIADILIERWQKEQGAR